jgi:hypothetical protein
MTETYDMFAMSVEEIKATVDRATPTERRLMGAYLKLKIRQEKGQLAKELGAAHRRIEAGQAASFEDVVALHDSLKRVGL